MEGRFSGPTAAGPLGYDALPATPRLSEWLARGRYHGYAYAYPHKTAYRPFAAPVPLERLWRDEERGALALYVHVPFCEFRCGFCNLFATHRAGESEAERFVSALERQAAAVRAQIGPFDVGTVAVGGGTPTWLEPPLLARLLDVVRSFAADPSAIPFSVETSPATATVERLEMLRAVGVSRVSIGVQSFSERTRAALGRPDRPGAALAALGRIARSAFPALNVDLVYGARGQSDTDLGEDIDIALSFAPTELYLYPLYVRPATGLGRRALDAAFDRRAALYAVGRAQLLAAGFVQRSMRSFVRRELPDASERSTRYRCQHDGTVGLGPGARSYTRCVHFADRWSVSASPVRASVAAYAVRPTEELALATHGIELDEDERQRRYVIQSLLDGDGVDVAEHAARFPAGRASLDRWVGELAELRLAEEVAGRVRLTEAGLGCSDAIGPWLYSPRVRAAMGAFEVR
jgi:oxygen-independent coproporphyrinogen-3 oxidase